MENLEIRNIAIPVVGLGTWALRGRQCTETVLTALDMGYRHIDTAQMYGNEAEIGKALSDTDVSRDDIFLTTKILESNLRRDQVLRSVQDSLRKLRTNYVDLLLIHWPSRSVPIPETIGAMNDLQHDGKVKHIGVSNFSVVQTREAQDASDTPIFTNQVEYHPMENREALLQFCREHDMILTAYSPLAKGRVNRNKTLKTIGGRHEKSAAQVALRWLIRQQNVIAIPKASGRDHLMENLEVFDFELTDEDVGEVDALRF